MPRLHPSVRRLAPALLAGLGALSLALAGPAAAHDYTAGQLVIDHPYAVPTPPGSLHGAAYLRSVRNTGPAADRLIGASTPIARQVEIHRMTLDGDVMRMRALPAIDIPAGRRIELKHGGEFHLMLMNLSKPLKEGDSFALTLRFERAGDKEVSVQVQKPRSGVPSGHTH